MFTKNNSVFFRIVFRVRKLMQIVLGHKEFICLFKIKLNVQTSAILNCSNIILKLYDLKC